MGLSPEAPRIQTEVRGLGHGSRDLARAVSSGFAPDLTGFAFEPCDIARAQGALPCFLGGPAEAGLAVRLPLAALRETTVGGRSDMDFVLEGCGDPGGRSANRVAGIAVRLSMEPADLDRMLVPQVRCIAHSSLGAQRSS